MSETTNSTWMPDSPLLLDKRQVAALLNISERSVGNLIRNKQLPAIHIGSRCLIRRTSVENLLLKREAKTQKSQEERP
jgi:excisionase family DNA binding protein